MTAPAPHRHWTGWPLVVPVVLLVAVVVLALVVFLGDGDRAAVTHRFVIPAGTRARLDAGEQVDIVPRRLVVHVGDRLLLRNKDVVQHHMGPLVVDANGLLSMTFGEEGTIKGVCTLNGAGEAVIVVRR